MTLMQNNVKENKTFDVELILSLTHYFTGSDNELKNNETAESSKVEKFHFVMLHSKVTSTKHLTFYLF